MSDIPQWFQRAQSTPYKEVVIEVDGVPIRYLEWGEQRQPGLVLIHGGAAHAHWWTFLAPMFAEDWHVVAESYPIEEER